MNFFKEVKNEAELRRLKLEGRINDAIQKREQQIQNFLNKSETVEGDTPNEMINHFTNNQNEIYKAQEKLHIQKVNAEKEAQTRRRQNITNETNINKEKEEYDKKKKLELDKQRTLKSKRAMALGLVVSEAEAGSKYIKPFMGVQAKLGNKPFYTTSKRYYRYLLDLSVKAFEELEKKELDGGGNIGIYIPNIPEWKIKWLENKRQRIEGIESEIKKLLSVLSENMTPTGHLKIGELERQIAEVKSEKAPDLHPVDEISDEYRETLIGYKKAREKYIADKTELNDQALMRAAEKEAEQRQQERKRQLEAKTEIPTPEYPAVTSLGAGNEPAEDVVPSAEETAVPVVPSAEETPVPVVPLAELPAAEPLVQSQTVESPAASMRTVRNKLAAVNAFTPSQTVESPAASMKTVQNKLAAVNAFTPSKRIDPTTKQTEEEEAGSDFPKVIGVTLVISIIVLAIIYMSSPNKKRYKQKRIASRQKSRGKGSHRSKKAKKANNHPRK